MKRTIARVNRALLDLKISEDQIIVGQSATELTYAVLTVLLDPRDRVIIFDPTYASYPAQIQAVQRHAKGIMRVRAFDRRDWTVRNESDVLADARAALKKFRPKLILFSSPDNPTGRSFSDTFIKYLILEARKKGAYVVMDLTYHALYFGDERPAHISFAPADYPNLIRIHSTSKWCRGLGRRLGWIEADERVIAALVAVQQNIILSPDTLHQMAFTSYLERALADGSLAAYLDNTRLAYQRAARATMDALRAHGGGRFLEPTGCLYVVMDAGRPADAFSLDVLKHTGVVVIPGGGFGPSLKNGVRISYGPLVDDIPRLEKGIARMCRFMRKK